MPPDLNAGLDGDLSGYFQKKKTKAPRGAEGLSATSTVTSVPSAVTAPGSAGAGPGARAPGGKSPTGFVGFERYFSANEPAIRAEAKRAVGTQGVGTDMGPVVQTPAASATKRPTAPQPAGTTPQTFARQPAQPLAPSVQPVSPFQPFSPGAGGPRALTAGAGRVSPFEARFGSGAGISRPEIEAPAALSPFAGAPGTKSGRGKQAKTAESWVSPEAYQRQTGAQERETLLGDVQRAQQELEAKNLGEPGSYQAQAGGQTKAQADFNAMLLQGLLPAEVAAEQKRLGALEARLAPEVAKQKASDAAATAAAAAAERERLLLERMRRQAQEDADRRAWEAAQRQQQQQDSGYESEYDQFV